MEPLRVHYHIKALNVPPGLSVIGGISKTHTSDITVPEILFYYLGDPGLQFALG